MQPQDVNPQDLTTQPANQATTAQEMRGKTTNCWKSETPAGNETHGQHQVHSPAARMAATSAQARRADKRATLLRTDAATAQADTAATNRMTDTAKNCVNRQTRQPTALTSCEETRAEQPATATRARRKLCNEVT